MAGPRHSRALRLAERDARASYWLARIGLNLDLLTPSATVRLEVLEVILTALGSREVTYGSAQHLIRKALRGYAERLDRQARAQSTLLSRNVDMLANLLGLQPLHKDLLAFAVWIQDDPALRRVAGYLAPGGRRTFYRGLAALFERSEEEMRAALSSAGPLGGNGLVCVQLDGSSFDVQLWVMEGLAERLLEEHASVNELMQGFVEEAAPSTLSLGDYSHLEADVELASGYLVSAIAQRTIGVNVLLYGMPGTGKTELARLVGARVGAVVFQVRCVNDAREALSGKERLGSYQLCQRFLAGGANAVIIFDEIEDVFPLEVEMRSVRMSRGYQAFGKAWMNALLETNPVPTIWISNEVSQIDRAYLRRFDFAIEFRRLPRPARRRILEKHLDGLAIPSGAIDQLADEDALLPSQVAKAAKIVRLWPGDESGAEAALGRVVQAGMSLLDMRANVSAKQATHRCRLDYFSTDMDIPKLIANLKAQAEPSGALCFFGPPGTGKTMLAHVVATELERPLMAKKGSDLLSAYVGETEQGIAQMFDTAREEDAVLLLDEVDGLLMDRQQARQRWELTQVNEILTQMDQFNGLLICSTNLESALDVASLRRFDIKVRFDYLTQRQRWRLFLDVLALDEETIEARRWCEGLKRLDVLTPADFAVASRRAALLGLTLDPASLFQLLADECDAKQALSGRPIGFLN